MTIPNRTVSITGIFAADASTIIPADPIPGNSYRDTTMTGTVIREGWAFKTIVDSSKFNQAMYEYTSVTAQVEKYGFLPWSDQTDYVAGSVCLASNGNLYQAKQASGPSSTAVDPTVNTGGVWTPIMLGNTNSLFDYKWEDYLLNRQDWLRADSFSWQPGGTYSEAYNHLVADINGITATTETVGSYTITYYQATDGHKIVLADQESTVQSIYAESGVAWYYILDTTNTRFKLPRENPDREKLIQIIKAKGDGGSLGLTNDTDNFGVMTYDTAGKLFVRTGAYGQEAGASSNSGKYPAQYTAIGLTYDEENSGIVADMTEATSVFKGKKYLYFYVGQFSQSATEQTAGLNSSLFNGKADIDLNNITPSQTAKKTIYGWGMPDYTAGVSVSYTDLNAGYEAPYDGALLCTFGLNGTVSINSIAFNVNMDGNNKIIREIFLNKGDVIKTSNQTSAYSGTNMFFPLKGVNNA